MKPPFHKDSFILRKKIYDKLIKFSYFHPSVCFNISSLAIIPLVIG